MTLTEFLLARIGEDEEVARAAAGVVAPPWRWGDVFMWDGSREYGLLGGNPFQIKCEREVLLVKGRGDTHPDKDTAAHIVRHDPARVLAECEAKRRIVRRALDLIASFGDWDAPEAVAAGGNGRMWEDVTRRERSQAHDRIYDLAQPYADHPDFREEWRP